MPLRTRQPDVIFISHKRLALCAPETDPAPIPIGPELVVEVLSPSETRRNRADKISDYQGVGVDECWIVDPRLLVVEVLHLSREAVESVAVYSRDQVVESRVFPTVRIAVNDIFA
jgi:Uma2 family endonuclease